MRNLPLTIAVLMSVVLAGCLVSGKAVKPAPPAPVAPPPQPLSIPQTQVELPQPQPLDRAAFEREPVLPAAAAAAPPPEAPATPAAPARTTPVRRAPPPVVAAPAEPPQSPAIQEMVPAAESKRYLDQALGRRKEVDQIMAQLSRRRLTAVQQRVAANIRSFMGSSMDSEKRGDMRQADLLAERAVILARDLLNGK